MVEVAVVGRADDWLDEVPVAFVRGSGSVGPELPAEVIDVCASRLSDFKVPRDVYVVREMPRSTIGKVNKVQLRTVVAPDADRAAAEQRWTLEASLDPSGDAP